MNTAERNKVGFTEEQQQALGRVLSMACYGSNIVGATALGDANVLQMTQSMLVQFARTNYPSAEAFLAELREVARFCDLANTFVGIKGNQRV